MRALLLIVQILNLCRYISAHDEEYLEFPDGFSIGVATSAFQIEGAWNASGKKENIWDHRMHNNIALSLDGGTADVACDSYHKYKEDVQLIKNIGFNHYRFSISWSRVLPNGSPDEINKDGIQYYTNLINELVSNGIKPFVTLYHFDDVQSLIARTGGWSNESMVEYFADYARVMFRELGSKVKFWSTINEPDIYCKYYAYLNETAANTAYRNRYLCAHNLLKAHARTYHIYDEEFRAIQKGKIGLAVNSGYYFPKSKDDTESADIAFAFEGGWILNPIFSTNGDYPEVMKRRIAENSKAEGLTHSRLPEFSPQWIDYIKGTFDYLGLNHYVPAMIEPANKTADGRWYDDIGVIYTNHSKWKTTSMGFGVYPKGIGGVLRKITKTFNNPTIYILENGASLRSGVIDVDRVEYFYSYMKEVLLAIRDGCDVRAYTAWSLLDNFQWFWGYSLRYGIVSVDFKDSNRRRTPKLSSYWLKTVIHERKLLPYNQIILNIVKLGTPKYINGVAGHSSHGHCAISACLSFIFVLSITHGNLI
ncbi:myrosinase 1 [Diachasma alloeum]|uniref:myrosinase 1 n=1 Tax=Diachasma alloeum TaxID=454923 RepID=UPI0007381391|nr:myrosinase 1 [Diachasma alloeum]